MIKPTVGRVVLFWNRRPTEADPNQQPQAAIIAHVWSDHCVNLAIIDPEGNAITNPPTSIPLIQEGEELPLEGHYCSWMPYQIGQAKSVTAAK